MNPIRIIAAVAALSLATPVVAFAADDASTEAGKRDERGKRGNFPMKAEKFMTHVNKRIERVAARVEHRLERSKLSEDEKEEIRAKVAQGTAKVRSAAEKAAANGTVTREEAKRVRQLARTMRHEARKGHAGKRGPRGKTGKKRPRGKKEKRSSR